MLPQKMITFVLTYNFGKKVVIARLALSVDE